MVVNDTTEDIIRKGGSLVLENGGEKTGCFDQSCPAPSSIENQCRAYNLDGRFLGMLRFNTETGKWQPEKVFV